VYEGAIHCPVTLARHLFVEFHLVLELGYSHEFSARKIC